MLKRVVGIGVVGVLSALVFAGLCIGQAQPTPDNGPGGGRGQGGPGGAGGGRGGFGRGNFDPSQIQTMMDENSRQTLGASAEEWKVIGPRFNKVQSLARSVSGGGLGMFGIRAGGRGAMGGMAGGMMGGMMGQGLSAIMGEPTALDKARDSLYAVLDNTSATTDQLQAALKTFREAREKTKKELTAAQDDLRKVLTIQQEVTLVAMGLLD